MIELPRIDKASAGMLIVDMQNGFCHPRGELGRRGQGAALQAVVPHVEALVDVARRVGLRVYWSRQEHEAEDVTRRDHRIKTHISKNQHLPCLRGTWDAEIVDDLREVVTESDYVFAKHRASCFYNTTLEVALRMRGTRTLIIAGVTTNYCVDATIRDAYARDFDVVLVRDCCAARDLELHEATIRNTELFHGAVCTLSQLKGHLFGAESHRDQ